MLIAPTEPSQLHELGESSSVPEQYGADVLVPAEGFLIGVQRKQFPGDFISSLTDGRLSSSLTKLTKCRVGILLLEGKQIWSSSGALVGYSYGQGVNFTRSSLRSLMLSAQLELGVSTVQTDSITDTVDFLETLKSWAAKSKHTSLFNRPRERGEWERKWKPKLEAVHVLQGFDGVGPTLAADIYDHFDALPLEWTVTADQLKEVKGLGPGRVAKLTRLVPAKEFSDDQ